MTHAEKVKEFYREQGRIEEQNRIINLLEVNKSEMETDELEWGIDRAIALIKGDNE
jgi:hypothetical protein